MCIYIRMVFDDMSTKEEILDILPLNTGRGYFPSLHGVSGQNQPAFFLTSLHSHRWDPPRIVGRANDFVACVKDRILSQTLSIFIALSTTTSFVRESVEHGIHDGCARSLQRRLLCSQVEDTEAEHTELLLHTEV